MQKNSSFFQEFLEEIDRGNSVSLMSRRIIETILDSQYDAVVIVNTELRILFVSKNFEKITGVKNDDIIGKCITILEEGVIHGESASRQVLATKKPVSITHKSVSGNDLLNTASPVFDDSGELSLIVINLRDVTDLNRLHEQTHNLFLEKARYEKENLELRAIINYSDHFVARSIQMKKVAERAILASCSDASVLITGDSGVGKGVLAKFIHNSSSRGNQTFIQVNCSSIPENLFESELFGYEEGAFSGARHKGKPGLIEIADGGTFFLDEIGDMPLLMQGKLLNFLQDKCFFRVGSVKKTEVNVRIIAATNVNLEEKVKSKQFREDLYYRLNVVPLHIPPLRERLDDIIPLANGFLSKFNKNYGRENRFSTDAPSALMSYSWPGNVRELENTIERLVILSDQQYITAEVIKKDLYAKEQSPLPAVNINNLISLPEATELTERKLLELACQQYTSSRQIAKLLGTSHPTVNKKLKQYGIEINKTK
ncbi:MAG: sigma 54-interacting transcriptional regulator [Thermincola sp.]|nr:sigma 54-interacting transcriptional regulator [Thermincola sp.]